MGRSSCQLVVNFVHYLFVSEEEKQYSSIDDQTKNAEKCQVDAAEIEYLGTEQCRIFIFIRYIIYYILYQEIFSATKDQYA